VIGAVRLRQIAEQVGHRLSVIPILYVFGSIVLVQTLLFVDRSFVDETLPTVLETTVDSARAVFAAIAGGLITSITLLLSMMLVAVQLASSQFSPRTLRDWLGNRTLQNAVGFVLGTTVFCLLALRSTRDVGEDDDAIIPHITVLTAVALGVLSLVAVVRAVDHITDSLRVSSVAERVSGHTVRVIERVFAPTHDPAGRVGPESGALRDDGWIDVPVGATPLEAPASGWAQQIDDELLLDALPPQRTGYLTVTVGGFITAGSPLLWIAPGVDGIEQCRAGILDAIALGNTRTMQQDAEFGMVQLTDIAVRALSPGVNDPGTACDVIVHLGTVMAVLWQYPAPPTTRRAGTRTIVRRQPTHAALFERAFGPVVHYGGTDRQVVHTLTQVVSQLRSEARRRELPGPVAPLDELLDALDAGDEAPVWDVSRRGGGR